MLVTLLSTIIVFYWSLIFSCCNWPACCFKNAISFKSFCCNLRKSFSKLLMSSKISFKISFKHSVLWCSSVAHSDLRSYESFLLSFRHLIPSFKFNYTNNYHKSKYIKWVLVSKYIDLKIKNLTSICWILYLIGI